MAAPKYRAKRAFTPIGMLLHAWVNKPDTKFVEKGAKPKFKTKLVLDSKDGPVLKALLEEHLDKAYEAETADMKPADAKKWKKAELPMEEETDDDGNPTGRLIFKFSQNATLKTKDGEEKKTSIAIIDSKGNPAGKLIVFSGTMARVGYSIRSYPKADGKVIGITLDFDIVKVIKPATRSIDTGPDDDGWTAGDDANDFDGDDTPEQNTASADGDGDF